MIVGVLDRPDGPLRRRRRPARVEAALERGSNLFFFFFFLFFVFVVVVGVGGVPHGSWHSLSHCYDLVLVY